MDSYRDFSLDDCFCGHSDTSEFEIDETQFDNILRSIAAQSPQLIQLAIRALSWLLFSTRPLTDTELSSALALEIGTSNSVEGVPPAIDDVFAATRNLVSFCDCDCPRSTVRDECDIVRLDVGHNRERRLHRLRQNPPILPH